jgi:hypothetical protein
MKRASEGTVLDICYYSSDVPAIDSAVLFSAAELDQFHATSCLAAIIKYLDVSLCAYGFFKFSLSFVFCRGTI